MGKPRQVQVLVSRLVLMGAAGEGRVIAEEAIACLSLLFTLCNIFAKQAKISLSPTLIRSGSQPGSVKLLPQAIEN